MGKPHPIALRERVVAFVDEGNSHREAARHFRVSPRFVNDMIKLRNQTGGLAAKKQGNPGRGKLTGVAPWVRERVAAQGDLTLDALVREISDAHGIEVHRSAVGRLLHRLGLTHKKTCKRLNKRARTWRRSGASGSGSANPPWQIIQSASSFWTKPGSRPT